MGRGYQQTAPSIQLTLQSESLLGKTGKLSKVDIEGLKLQPSTRLQTVGANGTTRLLALQIDSAAQQQRTAGKISAPQYDALMELANQGHRIGQIEGLLADAVSVAGGDSSQFSRIQLVIDGNLYTVPELYNQIGFMGSRPESPVLKKPLMAKQTGNVESDRFLALYRGALASGALNDPVIKATIESASTQILQIGEVMEHYLDKFNDGKQIADVKALNTVLAGVSTHMESGKICVAGDFQDNGVTCRK